jgi:hypothetical protein
MTPIGNNPSPNWSQPSNTVENKSNVQNSEDILDVKFNAFVLKVQKFIGVIKVFPNYLQEIPKEHQPQLQELTAEAHELLGLHPLFTLESARKICNQMKTEHKLIEDDLNKLKSEFLNELSKEVSEKDEEDKELLELLKDQQMSSIIMDSGGLLKNQERKMKILADGICEMDKIVRFQENPKEPLSQLIKFPLIEVSLSVKRLIESGLFQ